MGKTEMIYLREQALLKKNFRKMNLAISDYTFANVFLFRDTYRYQLLGTPCGTFISAHNRHNENYIMPLLDLRTCNPLKLKDLIAENSFFFPIPEEWLSFFPADEFIATYDEGESDYIYLTENLALFQGRQFVRHRNHLNQFFSSYKPSEQPLSSANKADCLHILQIWQEESGRKQNETDFAQCEEALLHFSSLALRGTIYYIDNQSAGFVIGEELNDNTFCLHFAKASKKYHGIYEFMFNDSAKRLAAQYKFMNLEEDMGNKNLRRTKASYGPEILLKKYRVHLRKNI